MKSKIVIKRVGLMGKFLFTCPLIIMFIGGSIQVKSQEIISKSFELRFFSNDPKANGETDFKGETTVLNTDERISFLKRYADFATAFFEDPKLDKLVVEPSEVTETLAGIKPQPLPSVRQKIALTDWKYYGYRTGQREAQLKNLDRWNKIKGLEVNQQSLLFTGKNPTLIHPIDNQDWRFRMEWKAFIPKSALPVRFSFDNACETGIDVQGVLFYVTSGERVNAETIALNDWSTFLIEVDLETGKYNFYVNDKLIADFVPLSGTSNLISEWQVKAGKGFRLDDIWGVSYRKTYDPEGDHHTRDEPFSIDTFIDESFEEKRDVLGWQHFDFDDSSWKTVPRWPYAHGGERHKEETLYLRTIVKPDSFKMATLKMETIDPSGEIWINGKIVQVLHNQHPMEMDISKFLHPGADNLIAIKVNPYKVEFTNRHTPSDIYTGWYTGRMWVELTDERRIKDIYTFTKNINENESEAHLEIECTIQNDHLPFFKEREWKSDNSFTGKVLIELFKWYPQEESSPSASVELPVSLYLKQTKKVSTTLAVERPDLWSPEHPNLYKVVITIKDDEGNAIDDDVITTGIRTISQQGGTFRINGKPAMMNGALSAAFRAPLEKISQWFRCGPEENLVEEFLMLKKMNGNTMRMTLNDALTGNINDPRYAEIADQLGLLFQWGTPSWVRTDSPYWIDFDGLPKYVQQLRNHPSIGIWQPANHPMINGFEDAVPWIEQIYEAITSKDRSRLISPTASSSRINPPNDIGTLDHRGNPTEPEPIWTAPLITRGNMDFTTGYGLDWSTLRAYPYPKKWSGVQNWMETGYRTDYLASTERAYFDYESEESIGQPNWSLHKGKPQYKIQSYEFYYDENSIGRILNTDEWRESQAWQAMSGYEAYRKKRWLDYDGQTWCNLRGGHNSATYQKPLIDYYGHAKLSFYSIGMVFQPVLAGSKNVDMVYGPEDEIPV
ncbi:MAG: hypothetical protein JJU28_19250, partial [Cyclobacteriaceae bacterium]|nr:hypothetical protein [Cyclobacteriaceae bacterium]